METLASSNSRPHFTAEQFPGEAARRASLPWAPGTLPSDGPARHRASRYATVDAKPVCLVPRPRPWYQQEGGMGGKERGGKEKGGKGVGIEIIGSA